MSVLCDLAAAVGRLGDSLVWRVVLQQELEIEALRDEVLTSGALPGDFRIALVFDRRLTFPRTRVRLI